MLLWVAQARRWGLRFLRAEVRKVARQDEGFEIMLAAGPPRRASAVVCCAGARFKSLGVPGENSFQGRGVHHAAFEEAPRFKNEAVAVVGAGEAAIHQALLLSEFARRVYLINRGTVIKAHRLLRRRMASRANLVHVPDTVVEEMNGREKLEWIRLRSMRSRRVRRLEVAGVFVLIGKQKTSLISPEGGGGESGYFTAGDASGSFCRQVAAAAGKGMEAAAECIRHLEGWR